MKDCAQECYLKKKDCFNSECRMWLDFPEDNNCTLVAVKKNGPMTLKEIARRHNISIVRAKQIVDSSLVKIKSVVKRLED